MTLKNREATNAYLHALYDMPKTKPNMLAKMADKMAGCAFDRHNYGGFEKPSIDDVMSIETSIFIALCDANDVNWRDLVA